MILSETTKAVLLGTFGALILRLVNFTLRWEKIGFEGKMKNWAENDQCILVFWHGRQIFMPWIYLSCGAKKASRPMFALISQHQDGKIAAQIMKRLRMNSVAGSSSKGGREAMYELWRKLKSGHHIAITPDGPKGPARQVKLGIIKIASRSQVRIFPASLAFENFWKFRSWDGMLFPKPFSRAVLVMGSPILLGPNLNSSESTAAGLQLGEELDRITNLADARYTA